MKYNKYKIGDKVILRLQDSYNSQIKSAIRELPNGVATIEEIAGRGSYRLEEIGHNWEESEIVGFADHYQEGSFSESATNALLQAQVESLLIQVESIKRDGDLANSRLEGKQLELESALRAIAKLETWGEKLEEENKKLKAEVEDLSSPYDRFNLMDI